jgi:hypothetical protein
MISTAVPVQWIAISAGVGGQEIVMWIVMWTHNIMAAKIYSHFWGIFAWVVAGPGGWHVCMTYLIQKVCFCHWKMPIHQAQGSFYGNSNILGFPYL